MIGKRTVKGPARAVNTPVHVPAPGRLDLWMDKAILPGMLSFSKFGYILRKKSWHPITDTLEDRTIVITGATSGLGRVTAISCSQMGARVIVVGRSTEKVHAVCRDIVHRSGNANVRGEIADLGMTRDVRALVQRLEDRTPAVHVLINNAGALFATRRETPEGIERALAVNLVGPFLLTTLLLPKLKASAPARIVNVVSGGMYLQALPVNDLAYKTPPYDGKIAYARAKRGLAVFSTLLAQKYQKHGIAVSAVHPGWVDTPGIRKSLPGFYRYTRPILRTPEQGADTMVWLAASREAQGANGELWFDRRPHTPHVLSKTRETETDRALFLRALEHIAGVRSPV